MRSPLPVAVAAMLLVPSAFDHGCSRELPFEHANDLRTEVVASGLELPVHLTAPAGDPRAFVVELCGRVRILEHGQVRTQPFLDLSARVKCGGEQGLLSLAFHPRYPDSAHFFVYYIDRRGDTRVERFSVSADPNIADSASRVPILHVPQPYPNHNGGALAFGPDGMLYVGLGDGGFGGDPHRNGQKTSVLLGKVLRLDVDRAAPYAIPADNPFVGHSDARPEIWAYGLRNPWRFDFDIERGLFYLPDDGEHTWEEVNVVPAGRGGQNYGWCEVEGMHCLRGQVCSTVGMTMPVVEYSHADGCTMIGGVVYRGDELPELRGHFFFADHCQGWVRSFRWERGRVTQYREWPALKYPSISSFGTGGDGEVYIVSLDGLVRRIVGAT